MPPIAMNALPHRPLERGVGPVAKPRLRIGRDVCCIDQPEGRLEGPATCVRATALRRVAHTTVTERGELTTPFDRRRAR